MFDLVTVEQIGETRLKKLKLWGFPTWVSVLLLEIVWRRGSLAHE